MMIYNCGVIYELIGSCMIGKGVVVGFVIDFVFSCYFYIS